MLKVLRRLFTFILLIIVFLVLWVFLPLGDSEFEVGESSYFFSSSISIQRENAQIFDEVANFKFQEKYVIKSKIVRKAVKMLGGFLLPIDINVIAEPKEGDSEDFNYIAVIKSARLRRIIQIPMAIYRLTPDFRKDFISTKQNHWQVLVARDQDDNLQRLACLKDTIIISSDESMFKNFFEGALRNSEKVNKTPDKALLKIAVNNEHGLFEYYVNALKNEASYNVFRSAEQLRKINISLISTDVSCEHQGQMVFEFTAGVDLASSKKDVRFFMQLIRRIMDANSYMFKYTLEENINLIKVEYNLQKIRREN
jgi:hypothetical protein